MRNHKCIFKQRTFSLRIVVYFGIWLSLAKALVANNYYQRPCPQRDFREALQRYLSSIAFDTKEECVRVMCAPKPKRPDQQTMTPVDLYAKTPLRTVGLGYVSSANKALNELGSVIEGRWYVIADAQGNPIGVSTEEEAQGSFQGYNVPSGQPPNYEREGYLPPAYYGKPTSYTPTPSRPYERPGAGGGAEKTFDSNVCCSTVEKYYFNDTMKDITGAIRTLAQIQHTGSFQIIRHGFCGRQGICPGICEQVYVTLPLAIYPNDPGQLVTYRYFSVPGYCSCKVPAK